MYASRRAMASCAGSIRHPFVLRVAGVTIQSRPLPPASTPKHRVKTVKKFMKGRMRIVPAFPQFLACVCQGKAPRPRAHKCINVKSKLRHPGNSRRKRDKGTHHRQKPRQQHRDRSVLVEKTSHPIQIVMAHQHPFTIALDRGRPPLARSNRQSATPHCSPLLRPLLSRTGSNAEVNQVAGEGHDDFRRQGNACRLDAHQRGNAAIAAKVDHMRYELYEEV